MSPSVHEYDCVVVGSGRGGYVAAIRAAQLGLKTAVVEKDAVGGRCLNYACIPAKAVLRGADVLSEVRHAEEFGIEVGEPSVAFAKVGARRAKVIGTLTGGVSGLLRKNAVDVIEGRGALSADGDVAVDGRLLRVKRGTILAYGPAPDPGADRRDRHPGRTPTQWACRSCRAPIWPSCRVSWRCSRAARG